MFENDYNITGKHATYLKFLAAKNSGGRDADEASPAAARLFERYIDIFLLFSLLQINKYCLYFSDNP